MLDNIYSKAEEIKKAEEKQLRKIFLGFFIGALLLAAFLTLTGCASASPEKINAYMACLTKQARLSDDHRSDAQTIAKAIRDRCPTEADAVGRGDNDFVSRDARSKDALNAVLYARTHP